MSVKDAGPVANAGDPKMAHRNLATMNAGKSFVSVVGIIISVYIKKVPTYSGLRPMAGTLLGVSGQAQ